MNTPHTLHLSPQIAKRHPVACAMLVGISVFLICSGAGCSYGIRWDTPSPPFSRTERKATADLALWVKDYEKQLRTCLTQVDRTAYTNNAISTNSQAILYEPPYLAHPFSHELLISAAELEQGWADLLRKVNGRQLDVSLKEVMFTRHTMYCSGTVMLCCHSSGETFYIKQPFILCREGLRHYGVFTILTGLPGQ